MQMATPTPGHLGTMTPEQLQAYRWEQEIDYRNRALADEELDSMLPTEGYKVKFESQSFSNVFNTQPLPLSVCLLSIRLSIYLSVC